MKEWVRINLITYGVQILWDIVTIQCVRQSNLRCFKYFNVAVSLLLATLGTVGVVFVESEPMRQFASEGGHQNQFVWFLRLMAYVRLLSMFVIAMLLFLLCLISFCYICLGGNFGRLTRNIMEHKDQITRLPLVNSWLDKNSRLFDPAKDQVEECAICITKFSEGDSSLIAELNCHNKHIFHLKCIQNWVKLNDVCPICRTPILKGTDQQNK